MHFAMSSADLFMNFTETFQKDEPLVHMLYLKLQELIEKLARRVCKHVSESNYDELFQTQNILPLKDIVVSQDVKKELMHLPEKDILLFMRNVKEHYVAGCSHLIEKSLSNTALIKSLKCLSPLYIKNKKSCRDIVSIARKLPISIKEDVLIDEFKILQLEATESSNENERIDHYWRKLLNKKNAIGQKKYAEIEKVVKVALSLSHGNANIERRFSVSRSALTDEKASTSERTFNAILTIKDALKSFSNKPELVPMTSKLISMGQSAHKHYIMYMEEQKRLKEIEEKKKNEEICLAAKEKERLEKAEESRKQINQFEDKISKSKKEHEIASEASDRLFKEANNRLKSALQKGDLSEVSVAQGMLEGILSIRKTEQEKLREVVKLQKNVQKRKDNIISTFCVKKPKMT